MISEPMGKLSFKYNNWCHGESFTNQELLLNLKDISYIFVLKMELKESLQDPIIVLYKMARDHISREDDLPKNVLHLGNFE